MQSGGVPIVGHHAWWIIQGIDDFRTLLVSSDSRTELCLTDVEGGTAAASSQFWFTRRVMRGKAQICMSVLCGTKSPCCQSDQGLRTEHEKIPGFNIDQNVVSFQITVYNSSARMEAVSGHRNELIEDVRRSRW